MTEPSEALTEKAKRDGILVRGVILNHYATIEYHLDELLYRARRLPVYRQALPDRMPREVERRIELLDRILALPGPLTPLDAELRPALRALLEYNDLRHMAAHGLMMIEFDHAGTPTLRFQKFRQQSSQLLSGEVTMDPEAVHFVTARLSLYARTVLQLMQRATSTLPTFDEPDAEA